MSQLRQQEEQLSDLGLKVLVISFEAGPMTQAYVEDTNLRWPIIVDVSRALYEAYGMLRGSWWDIWGPRTWWAYAGLLARGKRMGTLTADPDQLGGDILIDPNGIVRLHHVGAGPADRPSIEQILASIRE